MILQSRRALQFCGGDVDRAAEFGMEQLQKAQVQLCRLSCTKPVPASVRAVPGLLYCSKVASIIFVLMLAPARVHLSRQAALGWIS